MPDLLNYSAKVAPESEADLLRFLSVYLHSDLVRYLLLLTAYQVSFERERVSLLDVKRLPFVHPRQHAKPQRTAALVAEVAAFVKKLEDAPTIGREGAFDAWRPQAETLISEYFDLHASQVVRIREVAELAIGADGRDGDWRSRRLCAGIAPHIIVNSIEVRPADGRGCVWRAPARSVESISRDSIFRHRAQPPVSQCPLAWNFASLAYVCATTHSPDIVQINSLRK